MNWNEKIAAGMRLIIEGCKENPTWFNCRDHCPFDTFCSSIYSDTETKFTSPDGWEEEGLDI